MGPDGRRVLRFALGLCTLIGIGACGDRTATEPEPPTQLVPPQASHAVGGGGDYGVVAEHRPGLACWRVTFEGLDHLEQLGAVPGAPITFDDGDDWRASTSPPGDFANNPSGTTAVAWLAGSSGAVTFDEPLATVSLWYSSAVDVRLDAFDGDGDGVGSVAASAQGGTFTSWDPIAVDAGANTIERAVLHGGRGVTGVDDLEVCQQALEVEIDVKPGSDRNPVNLRSRGRLTVALLTTSVADGDDADFDAADADPATIRLGDGVAAGVSVAERRNGSLMAGLEDVDGDGDVDLVLHFDTGELVDADHLGPDTEELLLNGSTNGGTALHAADDVSVVGGGRP